ncbi:hypothetical protein [Pigmentibacter ruber]|uniref:hypothetical protein n=1 Tax=Pigmentibacter ruber TaxID=2683196 RepID=UPI00131B9140|nr:hypothetical protein [Pigmentibacter ruber]
MKNYKFFPLSGLFELSSTLVTFDGKTEFDKYKYKYNNEKFLPIGTLLSNQYFLNGTIKCKIKFVDIPDIQENEQQNLEQYGAEIIINYDTEKKSFLSAGINSIFGLNIRYFNSQTWENFSTSQLITKIPKDSEYEIKVEVFGKKIRLFLNDVEILSCQSIYNFKTSQSGVWCIGKTKLIITDFCVEYIKPEIFMIMPFKDNYNERYFKIIKESCKKICSLKRADEIYNHGVLLNDIIEHITISSLIIADISEQNPNVYYEIGYAHAMQKPVILIGDRNKIEKIPFDISHFRVLFYEDSMTGGKDFQDRLLQHLNSILGTHIKVFSVEDN